MDLPTTTLIFGLYLRSLTNFFSSTPRLNHVPSKTHSFWLLHQERVHDISPRSSIAVSLSCPIARHAMTDWQQSCLSFVMTSPPRLAKTIFVLLCIITSVSAFPLPSGLHRLISRGIVSPSNSELLHNTIAFAIPALISFTLRM
jgi:hypothetical protein